jgi:hypothetical protein
MRKQTSVVLAVTAALCATFMITPVSAEASYHRALAQKSAAKSPAYLAAAALVVHTPDAHAGYSRSQFGVGWTDTDGNSCDTRDDILRRDLRGITASGSCKVTSGTLADPYTGDRVFYVRGGASEVDIDHVVALSNAWSSGADRWPYAKRVAIANDRLNLLAVGSSVNREKGDADASQWLPPARGYWCAYVARQVQVKRKYRLWVTAAEKRTMLQVLSTCPRQKLPSAGSQPTLAPGYSTARPATSTVSSGGGVASGSGTDPRFRSCKAAIAAGYGPYVRGRDAEYSWYRDGDGDGIACERPH